LVAVKFVSGKYVAYFVPTRFENTEQRISKITNQSYLGIQSIYDMIVFYWLDDELVTCKWKNEVKPAFVSNNNHLIRIPGLEIWNERN